MMEIGQKASITKRFTTSDVEQFANLSGDKNPIHLDDEFAAKSIFGKKIVHGFLYGSLISNLLANKLPGPGSIYLHQEMNFIHPVFHGDLITAVVTISKINSEKKIVYLETSCYNDENIEVLTGKAIIKKL